MNREYLTKLCDEAINNDLNAADSRHAEIGYILAKIMKSALALVEEQTNNQMIWITHTNITEAYIQQELLRLHAVLEGDVIDQKNLTEVAPK